MNLLTAIAVYANLCKHLIAEATLIGVLTAVAAWAGAARPRMAAVSPLAVASVLIRRCWLGDARPMGRAC